MDDATKKVIADIRADIEHYRQVTFHHPRGSEAFEFAADMIMLLHKELEVIYDQATNP